MCKMLYETQQGYAVFQSHGLGLVDRPDSSEKATVFGGRGRPGAGPDGGRPPGSPLRPAALLTKTAWPWRDDPRQSGRG